MCFTDFFLAILPISNTILIHRDLEKLLYYNEVNRQKTPDLNLLEAICILE